MTEEHTEEEKMLISNLQAAYAALGTSRSGPKADRYHEALRDYVKHIEGNGDNPGHLRASLNYWNRRHGDNPEPVVVEKPIPDEPAPQPEPDTEPGQLTLI